MGEYAKRLTDGEEIKIGTCENMYYLRFEDRFSVSPLPGNVDPTQDSGADGLRFRLPFPDEDDKRPGDYEHYNRGVRLCREVGETPHKVNEDFHNPETIAQPGIMQLHHQSSGLLLNVPCYHGEKLPDVGPSVKAFWNGKGHSLVLSSLRAVLTDGELQLWPVVRCRHCGEAWRYKWAEIWDFIDPTMQARLKKYTNEG